MSSHTPQILRRVIPSRLPVPLPVRLHDVPQRTGRTTVQPRPEPVILRPSQMLEQRPQRHPRRTQPDRQPVRAQPTTLPPQRGALELQEPNKRLRLTQCPAGCTRPSTRPIPTR